MKRFSFLLMLIIASSIKANGCTCLFNLETDLADKVEKSDYVFFGTVVDGLNVGDLVTEEVTFSVKKMWRGKAVEKITIKSLGGCKGYYKKGMSYVIFARIMENGSQKFLYVSSCESFIDKKIGEAVFLSTEDFQRLIDRLNQVKF